MGCEKGADWLDLDRFLREKQGMKLTLECSTHLPPLCSGVRTKHFQLAMIRVQVYNLA